MRNSPIGNHDSIDDASIAASFNKLISDLFRSRLLLLNIFKSTLKPFGNPSVSHRRLPEASASHHVTRLLTSKYDWELRCLVEPFDENCAVQATDVVSYTPDPIYHINKL